MKYSVSFDLWQNFVNPWESQTHREVRTESQGPQERGSRVALKEGSKGKIFQLKK